LACVLCCSLLAGSATADEQEQLSDLALSPTATRGASVWSATADALYWSRSAGPRFGLVYGDSNSGTLENAPELLSTHDLQTSVAPGCRVGLAREFEHLQVELIYLAVDSWSSARTLGSGVVQLRAETQGDGPSVDGLALRFGSSLQSAEANVLSQSDWPWSLLAGIRFVHFNDTFLATGDADRGQDVMPFHLPYRANNRLLGVQGGVQGPFWTSAGGAFALKGWGKLGLMGNDMHLSASYTDVESAFLATGHDTQFAMLGDVGLAATWDVSRHFRLQLGYQLLWLDGLALGPGQILYTNVRHGDANVQGTGDVFFHGASLGGVFHW